MEDISHIYQGERVLKRRPDLNSQGRKKQKKKKHSAYVKQHFKDITDMVHEAHEELESKQSPFRICVYQEADDIYIDVVTIDEDGKIDQVFKHNITNDELESLVQHIKTGRGLIFDTNV